MQGALHWGARAVWGGLSLIVMQAASAVTADDYARAERFLIWHESRYVTNGDIQAHWIGKEDRFWYERVGAGGGREWVVVDAADGRQTVLSSPPSTASPASRIAASAGDAVSPDGHWVVFRKGHDLWARASDGGDDFALTTDGIEHDDYGGAPGDSTHTVTEQRYSKVTPPELVWSPDSTRILTYRLDERRVKSLYLVQAAPENGSLRPALYEYRYALPGDAAIPESQLLMIDLRQRRTSVLDTPPLPAQFESAIKRHDVWWSADGTRVYFLRRDRFSKWVSLNVGDAATGRVRELLRETSKTFVQTSADTNPFGDDPAVRILKNGDIIWFSERDGWGHLYYYDATGRLRHPITRGSWLVRSIVRIDEPRRTVYFMASGREAGRNPYEQHLYRIHFDGSGLRLLTPEDAEHAPAMRLSDPATAAVPSSPTELDRFSPSGRFFVDNYSRPDAPPVFALRTADGQLVRELERADTSKLREAGYTPIEPFRVLAADGKTVIDGNLFRPSTFDPHRKCAVIDAIYPGPQDTRTRTTFSGAAFDYFEAQSLAELGFVVVTIDGRGTPHRSRAFLDYAYGRLDKASDIDDHIAGIRQLAQRYPYMDLDRVGIDGVSGGGFASAHGILTHPEFYKVAVSASGDHDARAYLSLWGETYNGPLSESDYRLSSNVPLAGNLYGKLLLMHGEMDDNVSPALTLQLADALIRHNKDFDLLLIPNQNHNAFFAPYFIRRKWDYFVRHLQGEEPPSGYEIRQPQWFTDAFTH
jgi:dipeptidyl-peptidase 4